MKKTILLAAFSGLVLACPLSASAAILVATLTGTVYDGLDHLDLFGGGDLAGAPYVITYRFDTSKGLYQDYGNGSVAQGGGYIPDLLSPPFPFPTPAYASPLTATLSITTSRQYSYGQFVGPGEQTFTLKFDGTEWPTGVATSGYVANADRRYYGINDAVLSCYDGANGCYPYRQYTLDNFIYGTPDDIHSTTPLTNTGIGGSATISRCQHEQYTCDFKDDDIRFGGGGLGTFQVTEESVPEPAAWALMLCGFGVTGAVLRRQRRFAAT